MLGSHLLLSLTSGSEKILAVKRKNSSLRSVRFLFESHPEQFNKIEWIDCDITDVAGLSEIIKRAEKVYHCAAAVSFNPSDAEKLIRTNVSGTTNIVNLCLDYRVHKLCYVSSVAAINRTDESQQITEDTPWKNTRENSNYAISKQLAEREVWRAVAEGLNAVIVNPGIIIGAGNWHWGSGRLISSVWDGLRFFTEGTTGVVSATDVAECMIRLMESEIHSERFIVVAENKSYAELLFAIADGLGKKRPSYRAGKILAGLAWKSALLKSFITGKQPFITKETALSGIKQVQFVNHKIRKATGIEFEKIEKVIARTTQAFLYQLNRQPALK